MHGHSDRVGVLAWNADVLASGSRDGLILQRDVRTHQTQRKLVGHQLEVRRKFVINFVITEKYLLIFSFWIVTQCGLIGRHQSFEKCTVSMFSPEDGLCLHMVSQPRRARPTSSPL
jgi:hypothetical protein